MFIIYHGLESLFKTFSGLCDRLVRTSASYSEDEDLLFKLSFKNSQK
jgi:hypothetical protein